jgi:hypothetical protein
MVHTGNPASERPLLWCAALLTAAFLSIVALQNHAVGFEPGPRGYLSAHGMTLAKNLITERNWLLLFTEKSILSDGHIKYEVYNQFPVFPFLLTGLVLKISEPNLATQIYTARQLMNLFFIAAMLLSFWIVYIMFQDPYLAALVTFAAFSSQYMLLYSDMVFNDIPALFGFMLALVTVARAERSRIDAKSIVLFPIVSISMGWQPFAVFTAWFLADLVRNIFRRDEDYRLFSRPSTLAFAIAVVWGALILVLELGNEWRVRGGEPWQIPAVATAVAVFGLGSVPYGPAAFDWARFVTDQIHRALVMLGPFSPVLGLEAKALLVATMVIVVFGIFQFRSQLRHSAFTLVVYVVSGALWAITMREWVSYHDFQAIFYVGGSIAFFIIASMFIARAGTKILASIACLFFVFSVFQINGSKEEGAIRSNQLTAEFQKIYQRLPRGSKVHFDGDRHQIAVANGWDFGRQISASPHAVNFYLSGTYTSSLQDAEFIISVNDLPDKPKLTDNTRVNLYRAVVPAVSR